MRVFSFCIYGSNPKYCKGMTENLKLISTHFPDWNVWIYVGNDVPTSYSNEYSSFPNTKCIFTNETGKRLASYRFFAIDDPDVDCMFSRDADSRVDERDQMCIEKFLLSEKTFHIIRDHPNHKSRIMAGMFGLKKSVFSISFQRLYTEWISSRMNIRDFYNTDELFLEQVVYPLVHEHALVHTWTVSYEGENVSRIPRPSLSHNFRGNVYGCRGGKIYQVYNI